MINIRHHLKLYAVTDRSWLNGSSLYEQVEAALEGGATMIQLREKTLSLEAFLQEAHLIKELTTRYKVPLIINDNIQVALLSHADGVHIGQTDTSIKEARALLGPHKIIGVTAKTPAQAIAAEQDGANYIGSGAVFGSSTKQDATTLSYESLQAICQATTLPVVAIGGITHTNLSTLAGSGISGVAVVSGLFAATDIRQAASELYQLTDKVVTL
ncbi:MAG: thiamine phosphate synthase [Cellulosilyticaceae bacterium]